jgi:hypothetical protein
VVTWTDYGPSYAQFFNKNGGQRTTAIQVGSSSSWSGNVAQLKPDEYVLSGGGTPSAILFNGEGRAIGSSFSPSLSGNDVFVQALRTSVAILSGPESSQFDIVKFLPDSTLTRTYKEIMGSDVGSYPNFLGRNETAQFAMFYTKPGSVQPYYEVFANNGKLVQTETELSQITDVSANGGSATAVWFNGLIARETMSGTFIFAWLDSSGNLWTGVTN